MTQSKNRVQALQWALPLCVLLSLSGCGENVFKNAVDVPPKDGIEGVRNSVGGTISLVSEATNLQSQLDAATDQAEIAQLTKKLDAKRDQIRERYVEASLGLMKQDNISSLDQISAVGDLLNNDTNDSNESTVVQSLINSYKNTGGEFKSTSNYGRLSLLLAIAANKSVGLPTGFSEVGSSLQSNISSAASVSSITISDKFEQNMSLVTSTMGVILTQFGKVFDIEEDQDGLTVDLKEDTEGDLETAVNALYASGGVLEGETQPTFSNDYQGRLGIIMAPISSTFSATQFKGSPFAGKTYHGDIAAYGGLIEACVNGAKAPNGSYVFKDKNETLTDMGRNLTYIAKLTRVLKEVWDNLLTDTDYTLSWGNSSYTFEFSSQNKNDELREGIKEIIAHLPDIQEEE